MEILRRLCSAIAAVPVVNVQAKDHLDVGEIREIRRVAFFQFSAAEVIRICLVPSALSASLPGLVPMEYGNFLVELGQFPVLLGQFSRVIFVLLG